MRTYRAYILNTVKPLEPEVTIVYLQAEKYGPAWQGTRATLNAEKNGCKLFLDADCKGEQFKQTGDDVTVVKIVDMKPRNVKLDKQALQDLINDPNASAEAKIEAMQAMLAGKQPEAKPETATA